MLSLEIATALKEAGLVWQPILHDFFAIPQIDMDEQIFVLTDMLVDREILHGWPAFTFNGAVEWALDYVLQADSVWIPRDDQLLAAILARVAHCSLVTNGRVFRCVIELTEDHSAQGAERHTFTANTAVDAYAQALLHLLRNEEATP